MIDDRKIWQAAKNLLERYGDRAAEQAEIRVRELGEEGEEEAAAFWMHVKRATESLIADKNNGPLH
jgi:hypothetical protein